MSRSQTQARAVTAAAPPRVFVVRGDLLKLACGHVVIPTDVHHVVASYWRDHLGRVGVEVVEGVARVAAGDGGASEAVQGEPVRVYGPFVAGEGVGVASRATWLVAAADAAADAKGPAEEVDLVGLDAALGEFRARYLDAVADAHGPPVAGARGEPKASNEDFCWPQAGISASAITRRSERGHLTWKRMRRIADRRLLQHKIGTHGSTCGLAAVAKVGAQCVSSSARGG